MAPTPSLTFNNGVEIPQVGFGVFLIPDVETKQAVASALDVGYRHIDTAKLYANERAVGEAVAESGIARDDLFITTKLANSDQGYDETLKAFDSSIDLLGLDYVDLYLIHWPLPAREQYVDTWRAFEKLYADGRVRSIGVSNFHQSHLQRLFDETEVVPAINQIELHPWLQQRDLRDFHAQHGIVTEAWSPIARGKNLDQPEIKEIGAKHSVSPAQVILRWHLDLGNVVIPKSVHRKRIEENLDLFGFQLDDEDRASIDALDADARIGSNPDTFNG